MKGRGASLGGMVEEEVTLGCHQGALFTHGLEAPSIDLACALSFLRIRRWLVECGTPLDQRHVDCTVDVPQLESFCRQRCAAEARRNRPSKRASHSAMSMWGASILRHPAGHGAAGPNRHPRQLPGAVPEPAASALGGRVWRGEVALGDTACRASEVLE